MTTERSGTTPELDIEALEALAKDVREYYLPPEQWSCVVCGAQMTFGSSGPNGTKYWCSKMAEEVTKPYSTERMDHSIKSDRWVHVRTDVAAVALADGALTLISLVRELKGSNERLGGYARLADEDIARQQADLSALRERNEELRAVLRDIQESLANVVERIKGGSEGAIGALFLTVAANEAKARAALSDVQEDTKG